ncbi:phospholipid carrier-dependent glycosyltransferase [Geodermatophilus sp. SYSU D00703]
MRGAGRHWGVLVLLVLGGAVRALAVVAYVPAFSFPDSISYLEVAETGEAQVHRPWGYSGFLALLEPVVPLRGVVVVQHVLGLLAAVLVYALLRRRGVRRLVACLATAPLALDGYLVQIEHYLMAESLSVALLVAALVLLLWRGRPSPWAAAGVGVLLGLGAVTRTVGVAVLGVVVTYLLVRVFLRTVGALAVGAAVVGAAAVLLPYALWFQSSTGVFALTDNSGHFLYGRVASFADCDRVEVPPHLRELCPTGPPERRPGPDWYVWDAASPANSGRYTDEELTEFSLLVIRGQPGEFAVGTAEKTLHYFLPGRFAGRFDTCTGWWEFPDDRLAETSSCPARVAARGHGLEPTSRLVREDVAELLVVYQDWVHVPGPVLAGLALAGLSGLVPDRRRRAARRDVLDGVLCVVVGIALVAVPSATAVFDYRYGLPLLAMLPIGAALATRHRLGPRLASDPVPAASRAAPAAGEAS